MGEILKQLGIDFMHGANLFPPSCLYSFIYTFAILELYSQSCLCNSCAWSDSKLPEINK